MREYSERLRVPASWWLLVVGCVALLGTTLWAGLGVATAIVIYAVLGGACGGLLLGAGAGGGGGGGGGRGGPVGGGGGAGGGGLGGGGGGPAGTAVLADRHEKAR